MNRDYILEQVREIIPEPRRLHTQGLLDTAYHLAELYGVDRDKVEMAGTCHDMYRLLDSEEINKLIYKYGVDEKYLNNPSLAHSKIAVKAMAKDFGITDEDILAAVEFHTTGRPGMSKLEKIIYLADAIEPGRPFPGVEQIRAVSEINLDLAVLAMLKHSVKHLEDNNMDVDEDSIKAIEYLEKEMSERVISEGEVNE